MTQGFSSHVDVISSFLATALRIMFEYRFKSFEILKSKIKTNPSDSSLCEAQKVFK